MYVTIKQYKNTPRGVLKIDILNTGKESQFLIIQSGLEAIGIDNLKEEKLSFLSKFEVVLK